MTFFLRTKTVTLCLCAALALSLVGCGSKQPTPVPTREGESPSWMGTVQDLNTFPQDLSPFARRAGGDTRLLSAEQQQTEFARLQRIVFGPWQMSKTTIRKKSVASVLRKARGYKYDSVRWTQAEWDALAANAHLTNYPNMAQAGITVRNTNLREVPTHVPRFVEPTPDPRANPFDYSQYSLLPVGTPLFIAHRSQDNRWYYVETPVAGGWVDANDVGLVSDEFQKQYRAHGLLALLKDKIRLEGTQAAYAHIGAFLPLASPTPVTLPHASTEKKNTAPEKRWSVLVPQRDSQGKATLITSNVALEEAAPMPVALTPNAIAAVGNEMMGQRYGWGGTFGDRDCSALTREILTPFGLWLPRNSAAQARSGEQISLASLSAKEKEAKLLHEGTPFLSLVWMRGHVMLYVGAHKGRPAIFHNVWGVRTVEGDDDNARLVIGRAVVTSLTPGIELPNLYRKTTFVDRIQKITTLPPQR